MVFLVGFAGVLNWEQRLWRLVGDFLAARNEMSEDVSGKEDLDLFDCRNFYLKGTSFGYGTSHQLSIVISKLQGLTNTLKVGVPYREV